MSPRKHHGLTPVHIQPFLGAILRGCSRRSSRLLSPHPIYAPPWSQVSTWFARGYKESRTRTVASFVVPGAQLRAAETGNERGRSSAAIADTARADLQEQLAAGAGTRHELLVPGNTLLTLQAALIEVKHMLSVTLKTPHCISSPDVWTPVIVHAGTTSSSEEVPGEGSYQAHSGEAVPFATTLDADGNVKPVSVPQSAVTMTYTNELPKF